MAVTAWTRPGTVQDTGQPSGAQTWTNLSNVLTALGDASNLGLDGDTGPDELRVITVRDFGFDALVPLGATIDGIEWRWRAWAVDNDNPGTSDCLFISPSYIAGAPFGSFPLQSTLQLGLVSDGSPVDTALPQSALLTTFGGATETYDVAPNSALVRGEDFGLQLEISYEENGPPFDENDVFIREVECRIHYTAATNTSQAFLRAVEAAVRETSVTTAHQTEVPVGTQVGDLLLLIIGSEGDPGTAPSISGWTLEAENSGATSPHWLVYSKVATLGDIDDSVSWTTANSVRTESAVLAIADGDVNDITVGSDQAATSDTVNAPGITGLTSGDYLGLECWFMNAFPDGIPTEDDGLPLNHEHVWGSRSGPPIYPRLGVSSRNVESVTSFDPGSHQVLELSTEFIRAFAITVGYSGGAPPVTIVAEPSGDGTRTWETGPVASLPLWGNVSDDSDATWIEGDT